MAIKGEAWMRVAAFVPMAIVCLLASVAAAQTWIQVRDRDLRVAIDFPGKPQATDLTYNTRGGMSLKARQLSLQRGQERYVLLVVNFPAGGASADEAEVEYAADTLRRRGTVRVAGTSEYDPGIPGRQLSILEPDGKILLASIFMYDHRLYIAHGTVPAGGTPPVQFQQSLTILDAAGDDLDLDRGGPNGGRGR
jgi:hypothetical protein